MFSSSARSANSCNISFGAVNESTSLGELGADMVEDNGGGAKQSREHTS
jgi:hypothetical protein